MKRKRWWGISLCILLLLILGGCGDASAKGNTDDSSREPEKKATYKKVNAAGAKQLMEQSESFYLLDPRKEEDYRKVRIEGAILVPGDEIGEWAEREIPDKDSMIFIYCGTGAKSETVAKALVYLGYTEVYDMGGIVDWPYDVITE